MDGAPLQKLGRGNAPLESVTLNVMVYEGKTSIVFAWIGRPLGPATRFVQSFAATPHDRMADAAVRLAFETVENVYTRPSWWDGLAAEAQAVMLDHIWNGVPGRRTADRLADKGGTYVAAGVESMASGWPEPVAV
jgi:hypothetical protein